MRLGRCAASVRATLPRPFACYQRCLDLGSRDAKAAYHLGNACKSLKRLERSRRGLPQSLEWDPDFVPAMYQLGNAYRQLNDLDSARRCLEKVLRAKTGRPHHAGLPG